MPNIDEPISYSSTPGELTVADLFDGSTIGPQFAIALKNFIFNNMGIRMKCGSTSTSGYYVSSGHYTVPHNLGVVPNLYSISSEVSSAGSPVTVVHGLYVDPANLPDATNFYLLDAGGGNATINFSFVAAYIPIP